MNRGPPLHIPPEGDRGDTNLFSKRYHIGAFYKNNKYDATRKLYFVAFAKMQ